ncbi:MAG: hypothetical protein KAY37_15225 [Phycisphaerae bacterium]|nr:hypothetical protein [Phycisphaerae bacterium]
MGRRRHAATREIVLLGLAAVLLVVAGWLYSCLSRGEAPPTDEVVGFYCPECDHFFELSHRDFEKLWDRGEFKSGAGGKGFRIRCEQCQQFTAERADKPPAGHSSGQKGSTFTQDSQPTELQGRVFHLLGL